MRTIISYEPLWKTLQEKGISQYYLLQNGLDNKTLDSLKKGKNITLLTLEKLCKLIDCTPNDIIESAAVLSSLAPHGVRRGCDW